MVFFFIYIVMLVFNRFIIIKSYQFVHKIYKFSSKSFDSTINNAKTKKISDEDDKSQWITINLNNDKNKNMVEMNERIQDAKGWVSKKLSDKDSELLNKELGIENEIFDLLNKSNKKPKRLNKNIDPKDNLNSLLSPDSVKEARILGYLEINPHVCSGCGTPFQSKSSDNPGYLSKEKFQEHFKNIQKIKSKQEAIKILNDAGIDINSSLAEDILKQADVSIDTIEGIKRLGRKSEPITKKPLKLSNDKIIPQSKMNINTMEIDKLDIDVKDLISDINSEVYTQPKRKIRRMIIDDVLNREDRYGNVDKIESNENVSYTALEEDNFENEDAVCVCQRCYRLQQYGTNSIESILRPGWSKNELLLPNRFELLLSDISKTNAVVVCIIDVFDLNGSLLTNLRNIIGDNPIVLGINKIDLLPKDISMPRLKTLIISEIKDKCGLQSPKDIETKNYQRFEKIKKMQLLNQNNNNSTNNQNTYNRFQRGPGYIERVDESGVLRSENVYFISCSTNYNIDKFLSHINNMALNHGNKVYVIGTANAGKSSFINKLIDSNKFNNNKLNDKHKGSRIDKTVPQSTVSNLPGTTLDFLKIRLSNGVTVIDTPGLINEGQLTSILTTEELKKVIPNKQVNAITLRVMEGKTVLIGGIASITLIEGRPFYFTFFISNEIKLHPTDSLKAQSFVEKHIGELIFPPNTIERLQELGQPQYKEFTIEGDSWKKSTTDIVISGLGWISVTGPGIAKVRVGVPKETSVSLRPAILPYEATYTTAKFTGGRLLKKSRKPGAAGANAYGWRA